MSIVSPDLGRRVSGELLEEAEVVGVEEADVVDAVFEHGDTRRLQPWR